MKIKICLFLLFLFVITAQIFAQDDIWLNDFNAAKVQAKSSGKHLLLNFSGSDWCVWCMKLSKEVFTEKVFLEYAKENLVLFMADFPRYKQQSSELNNQNEELLKQYKIEGFPTVIILDSNGEILFQTGYRRGGAESYVNYLKLTIQQHHSTG